MKIKNSIKTAYGAGGVLEGLIVYYLSRILGIALPLPVALALRALILVTSGHCLLDSIKKISPVLYRKLQRA